MAAIPSTTASSLPYLAICYSELLSTEEIVKIYVVCFTGFWWYEGFGTYRSRTYAFCPVTLAPGTEL